MSDGYVHPELRGLGAGGKLVDLAEERARAAERCDVRPERGRLARRGGRGVLEGRGYCSVRHFYRMAIELGDEPPEPEWPDGVRVEPFDEQRRARLPRGDRGCLAGPLGPQPAAVRAVPASACSRARGTTRRSGRSSWAGDEIAGGTICEAGVYEMGWVRSLSVRRPWRRHGLGMALLLNAFAPVPRARRAPGRPRRRRGEPDRQRLTALVASGPRAALREPPRRARVSTTPASCSHRTHPGRWRTREPPAREVPRLQDVHGGRARAPSTSATSAGAGTRPGLVRVPRAWGEGGEPMAEAAHLPLPFPEAAVVAEDSLHEQTLAIAAELPARPILLGGCCCAHVGAVTGLASRHDRVAVVWLDAHGDLNTIESSPTGNPWATPLRTLIDAGTVNADRRRARRRRATSTRPRRTSSPRAELHLGEDGLDAALEGCRLRLRRARLRRARPGRDRRLHARAGRPDARRGGGVPGPRTRAGVAPRRWVSPAASPRPRTPRS